MPWSTIKLNDDTVIPNLAFGTWKLGNAQLGQDRVIQAFDAGFTHIDTAQNYGNENEAGDALHRSGISRDKVYITTKYSGRGTISDSIRQSLIKLRVDYVDLYLLHAPEVSKPDIQTAWAEMEKLQAQGLAKSIGVSNYEPSDLDTLLKTAKIVPAVNQILFHPYVYAETLPLLDYCAKKNIVIEAYSPLIPITSKPGGSVDKPVARIAAREHATPAQVLLAWAKAKGTVVITSSRERERLDGYIQAGDLELTKADIDDIDVAGALGSTRF
ncbi:Aldo/keto reductase [Sistotremastrum niveocremeum HHB9708]|uniref:Aldo/keto reductase n=1 Tax=Sistotremastrum niveocremeum HHB9708 TaxID=1314777 RepID=A0A164SGZ6_9AGAM|nr:Aldo/keto reductase [Sistotremastrum niveocremeum HHB9708]